MTFCVFAVLAIVESVRFRLLRESRWRRGPWACRVARVKIWLVVDVEGLCFGRTVVVVAAVAARLLIGGVRAERASGAGGRLGWLGTTSLVGVAQVVGNIGDLFESLCFSGLVRPLA